MNSRTSSRLASAAAVALCASLLAASVRADGNVGFLTTHTTQTAGQPFSWMERSRDWLLPKPTSVIGGRTYAVTDNAASVPTDDLHVETWRETAGSGPFAGQTVLRMRFDIPDATRRHEDNTTLKKGDRVVIQLDPDYSRSPDLAVGTTPNPAADYRFEVVIKDNLVDTSLTGVKFPEVDPNGPNNWGAIDTSSLPAADWVTLDASSNTRYIVTATIPYNFIGRNAGSTSPVGITYVYLNDIGHQHVTDTSLPACALCPPTCSGCPQTSEMVGTQFPSSMGLSVINDNPGVSDLGLVTSSLPASGSWINPSAWGTGYFGTVAGDVQLSHTPSYVLSDAIRLGVCTTTLFSQISPVVDWNTNQLTLPGWYQYYPGMAGDMNKPCKMRVWVRANQTAGSSPAQRRFFIIWGRPNIGGTKDWFQVALTPAVTVNAPSETFSALWETVPKENFTNHPCLRVYVLPATLTAPFDDAYFNAHSGAAGLTQADLDAVEAHYGMPSPELSPYSAQMNFTALHMGAACPSSPAQCLQTAALEGDGEGRPAASGGDGSFRFVKAGFDPAAAAPKAGAAQRTDTAGDEGRDTVRVFVEGYGVESAAAKADYVFTKVLGAVGTMVSNKDLVSRGEMTMEIDVTNPRVERRNFRGQPLEVVSPPRDIFLNVIVKAAPGVTPPAVTVKLDRDHLGPGETTKGTVVVKPAGGGTTVDQPDDGFKRWGLSLHAGASFPHDNLGNAFNPGPNAGVDLEYRFDRRFSLEALYTFNRFRGESFNTSFGPFHIPDLNLHVFSLNGKVYGGTSPVRPFFNFGGGAYVFHPSGGGSNTRGGLNVGGGLQFDVSPNVALDAMYNFHNVFNPSSDTKYSTAQAGVRFRF
ncbi:MAG TPA: porin family protein [Pyrinomonadaceae bacterium]|jgi:opacity protein-like surface antigen